MSCVTSEGDTPGRKKQKVTEFFLVPCPGPCCRERKGWGSSAREIVHLKARNTAGVGLNARSHSRTKLGVRECLWWESRGEERRRGQEGDRAAGTQGEGSNQSRAHLRRTLGGGKKHGQRL